MNPEVPIQQISPVQQIPNLTPPTNKSNSLPTMGIVFLIIILISTTAYCAFQYFHLKNQIVTSASNPKTVIAESSPLPTVNPIANWKTYTADKIFGFSIQYPPTYTLSDNSAKTVYLNLYPLGYNALSEIQKASAATITIQSVASAYTPQAWVNSLKAPGASNVKNISNTTVSGASAIQYTFNNTQAGNGQDQMGTVIPFKNNSLLLITLNSVDKESELLYSQILSTVKFLDQTTDISAWKTYTNKQYGIEFAYPSSWENFISEESNGYLKTDSNNTVDVSVVNDTSKTISDYLQKADKLSETAYEDMPSYQVQSIKKTTINGLNCIQRQEYLIAADLTKINTYFKKGDVVVSISLRPTPGNSLSDDTPMYNQLLSTFHFSDSSPATPLPTQKIGL
jgi:hypothetical protein